MLFDDINEATIMGNVTQDPEIRFTPSGTAVINFSVATNRSYKSGNEWKEEVTFHNVVAWANLAQQLSTRIKKGTRVHVTGRLQTRTWESDGRKNYRTEIIASNVLLIDRYNKGENAKVDTSDSSAGNAANSNKFDPVQELGMQPASNMGSDVASNTIDPDDLPF